MSGEEDENCAGNDAGFRLVQISSSEFVKVKLAEKPDGTSFSFSAAQAACRKLGAELWEVKNEHEWKAIANGKRFPS